MNELGTYTSKISSKEAVRTSLSVTFTKPYELPESSRVKFSEDHPVNRYPLTGDAEKVTVVFQGRQH